MGEEYDCGLLRGYEKTFGVWGEMLEMADQCSDRFKAGSSDGDGDGNASASGSGSRIGSD